MSDEASFKRSRRPTPRPTSSTSRRRSPRASPAPRTASAWPNSSAAALTKAGDRARVHEMPGAGELPEQAEMRVLAPVELSIEANTLGHSLPTLPTASRPS